MSSNPLTRSFLSVVFLAGAVAGPTMGQAPATPSPQMGPSNASSQAPAAPRNDIPGLPNFAQVSPTLYRGAQPSAEGFAYLKSLGVKTVINLRDHHSDLKVTRALGLRYVAIPCETHDPEEAQALLFLKAATAPENQPVFVHCKHGSDRTGMMVALYRMVEQGWTRESAIAELSPFGFHTLWRDIKAYLLTADPAALKAMLGKK